MSKGSISKKKNPTPEKGIRKVRKKKKNSNGVLQEFKSSAPLVIKV
jgi:hypothetical protein